MRYDDKKQKCLLAGLRYIETGGYGLSARHEDGIVYYSLILWLGLFCLRQSMTFNILFSFVSSIRFSKKSIAGSG